MNNKNPINDRMNTILNNINKENSLKKKKGNKNKLAIITSLFLLSGIVISAVRIIYGTLI